MPKRTVVDPEDCPYGIKPGTWYIIIVVVASILIIGILAAVGQVVRTQREWVANAPSASVSNVIIPIRGDDEISDIAMTTMTRLRFEGAVKSTDYNFGTGKWTVRYEATSGDGMEDIEIRIDDRTLKIEKIYFLLVVPELRPVDIRLEGQPVLGNKSAPLVMIEFGDFDCAYCKIYHDNAYQQIESEYIDKGKLRYIFINYPLTSLHTRAQRAAEAAECAHEQGKFWEYRDVLRERWDPEAEKNALSDEDLKAYAREIGLDGEDFDACLESGETVLKVQDDYQESIKAGATVAPAFYIGGNLIGGVQSFEMFKQIIDYKLKN